ncbi:MAG: HEAT repeat domain-containing protein, partial [Planctomycetales bacterium]
DADGSLLVADTGGWFLQGCPTSRISKPDVLGAIYRIRRRDAPTVRDPRGTELPWDRMAPRQLTKYLDDPRPMVRDRAVKRLASLKDKAIPSLAAVLQEEHGDRDIKPKNHVDARRSVDARRNAVWALSRIETDSGRSAVRSALDDSSMSVRLAAARSAGLVRDSQSLDALLKMVVEDEPPVRREAATAVGRIREAGRKNIGDVPTSPVLAALFESVQRPNVDRFLEHSLIYAVIRVADREAALPYLRQSDPRVQRAALIALDQMHGDGLTKQDVVPLLSSPDAALQATAFALIGRRRGWSELLLAVLGEWLREATLTPERGALIRKTLASQGQDSDAQRLIADTLADPQTPPAARLMLLEIMQVAEIDKPPKIWLEQLARSLDRKDPRERRQVVEIIQHRNLLGFDDRLRRIAEDSETPAELRVAALVAIAPRLKSLDDRSFALLSSRLDPSASPLIQMAAARALGESRLSDPQLIKLAGRAAQAGPMALPALTPAFARSNDDRIGSLLIESLNRSPGANSLSVGELANVLKGYSPETRAKAEPLLKRLGGDPADRIARLEKLAPLLVGGDATRGRRVFHGAKAACSSCHMIGGRGANIGPNLTGVGKIRAGRDLLEAMVFPSASFARGFRPVTVAATDGRIFTGLISRQSADAIYLRTAKLAEVRVLRSNIEQIAESAVSIMPKGLDAALSPEELRDLLAFLQSQR